jgi:hypothetical protein
MATRADIYVGLIGWNYGSSVRESPDISYTQLEFRKAGEAGVPRLVFMLEGERGEGQDERQLQFRQEILDSGITVKRFESAAMLEGLVYQALIDGPTWDPALGSAYLEAVQDVLSKRHLGGDLTAPSRVDVRLSGEWKGSGTGDKRVDDVRALAMSAARLVLLGGPGSGKSHIARHAAAGVARKGLRRISECKGVRDIEIPLYTTVAALIDSIQGSDSIWGALLNSALREVEQSLPAIRMVVRLRELMLRCKEKFFVVLDGLDEAGRKAPIPTSDLLATIAKRSHRFLLTSRPGAWHGQLELDSKAYAQGVVELNKLGSDEMEALIRGALAESDAERLLHEIYRRADLKDAARVPIIALLCCAVGAKGDIPPTRHELYELATNRILNGIWRKDPPDDVAPIREARRFAEDAAWRSAERGRAGGRSC